MSAYTGQLQPVEEAAVFTESCPTSYCKSTIEHYPSGGVIARVFLTANPSVYTPVHEPAAHCWCEKKMIQPHPLVQWPPITLVVPERPERTLGLQFSQSIRPTLS